jgi:hypothetical protein
MTLNIAWLGQGKLRYKCGEQAPATIESRFANGIRERAVKAQQRHSWKFGGGDEKFLSAAMLWGRANHDPAAVPIAITSLCRTARDGELLYSLETDSMCAILAVDSLGADERRLWHKNDKRVSHLAVAEDGALACSVRHKFGTANIAVRVDEEAGLSEVTEGDSVDTAPRWVPGARRQLVFQSAGVGRNREGHFAALGPYCVQLLEVETGTLTTLAEDSGYDFLTPFYTQDGTLYFIRRPYRTGRELNPLTFLKDILLFPFRLLLAIFHYLQFFSLRYRGKKLTSSGGAAGQEPDMKEMMIWGNMVSAQAARNNDDSASLVPSSWELVRRKSDGTEAVLAKGVVSFDVADGSVVYSNGNGIFLIGPDGRSERIVKESMIEQVVVLPSAATSGS